MDESLQRSFYLTALSVARADGAFDPAEKRVLRGFLKAAGIEREKAWRWFNELEAGATDFRLDSDHDAAPDLMKLTIELAEADGRIDPAEWRLLLQLAKALGLSAHELSGLLPVAWRDHFIETLFPGHGPPPAGASTPSPQAVAEASSVSDPAGPAGDAVAGGVVVVTDGFDDLDELVAASPNVTLDRRALPAALTGDAPRAVLFHAATDRAGSERVMASLRGAWPDALLVLVVQRHQAFQVGHLLEREVDRCLVEPIFPGELGRLLAQA